MDPGGRSRPGGRWTPVDENASGPNGPGGSADRDDADRKRQAHRDNGPVRTEDDGTAPAAGRNARKRKKRWSKARRAKRDARKAAAPPERERKPGTVAADAGRTESGAREPKGATDAPGATDRKGQDAAGHRRKGGARPRRRNDAVAAQPEPAEAGRSRGGDVRRNERPRPSGERRPYPSRGSKGEREGGSYAALDLGTNNCRLLVAQPGPPGRFRVVDAFSRIVRLGEGLEATGRLSDAAMDRAVEALKACAAKLSARPIRRFRLIATEACRRADNGEAFLVRVRDEAGLDLEIVDRETEARLAVAGCSALLDPDAEGAVLFDIGGGSSELALLDLRRRRRHDLDPAIVSWTSLPVGVVTLSERFGGGRTVTREVFDAMVDDVRLHLEGYADRGALGDLLEGGNVHLLGTSGTVTTLAGIHLELPRYDRRRVDGTWLGNARARRLVDGLLEMNYEERMANPCIGRDRADLVLAGCAILQAIQDAWPCERLRVADRGLREGLLTSMMNADRAWQRRPRGGPPTGPSGKGRG